MAFSSWTVERKKFTRTLACFLQGMQGKVVTVELRDFTLVQGKLASCDCYMNLDMENTSVYARKRRRTEESAGPLHYERFFVACKFIRFVHFTNYVDAVTVLQRATRKIARGGTGRWETSSKAYKLALARQS